MEEVTKAQLQQAQQLIKAGQRKEAYQLLRRLLQADPNNAQVWWLVAHAVPDPDQQRKALQHVLRIRPDYQPAQQALDKLKQPADAASSGVGEVLEARATPEEDEFFLTPVASEDASPISSETLDIYDDAVPAATGGAPPASTALGTAALMGVLFGSAAGVIAGVVWVLVVVLTKMQIGVVAVIVGLIVGGASFFGAGSRRNLPIAVISVIVTLAVMGVSQYFIVRHFTIQELAAEGVPVEMPFYRGVSDDDLYLDEVPGFGRLAINPEMGSLYMPILFPPGTILAVAIDSLGQEPITLVFWGIALWSAFSIPSRGSLTVRRR
ncbi:MAG: tetratricopeptide repeat protein [Anaerolineae bacterium]|nr:tetratricopeptide repeat protein [Anaerolineae bacterium]